MPSAEERLAALEAKDFARAIVLRAIVTAIWRDVGTRVAARDRICDAVEALYEQPGLVSGAHIRLQTMLDDIEALFEPTGSGARTG